MEKSNINNSDNKNDQEYEQMESLQTGESLERDFHLMLSIYILRKMKLCCPACKIQGMYNKTYIK